MNSTKNNGFEFLEFISIKEMEINHYQPFIENEETAEIKLWDVNEGIGVIDEVDVKIVDYV